ncbi:type IV toxin-antitoxin system AbiEi family antitoxin [Flavobacterium sp.]|uniref:type IV toxin-antitoxin system AbiEi family antitoxin n=1 Tax=Flavobacterium sp. TaxID=239 RepID=UPI00391DDD6C
MDPYTTIVDYFNKIDFEVHLQLLDYYENKKNDFFVAINGEKVLVEIRAEIRPEQAILLNHGEQKYMPYILAAKYITPKAKEYMKTYGINYIDSFGNAYLDLNNLKLYIEKGDSKPVYNDYSQIFTATGGKVLFHLLANDDNINNNYRHLAQLSGVSLGSVSKLIHGLFREGFAIKINSRRFQLVKKEELLERWIVLLNEKILPAQKMGTYTFTNKDEWYWRNRELEYGTQWGGEPAAAIITEYLNPEKFTIFTIQPKSDLIKSLRIVPDNNGEITIYRPFWEHIEDGMDTQSFVHPLIVYAELMYSGNSRNKEVAEMIYQKIRHEF